MSAVLLKALLFSSAAGANAEPVSAAVEHQIADMTPDLLALVELGVRGAERGASYNRTADFCDRWGHRISGSRNLEDSIDSLAAMLQADGLSNVHYEPAMVPHWVRGEETCRLLAPTVGEDRQLNLHIMSLGGSVGTPNGLPVEAEVMVVSDWAELVSRRSEALGKIVVYAVEWEGYTATQAYRSYGATVAAKFGAVASMMRSAGPFSINSPHTGSMTYMQERADALPADGAVGQALKAAIGPAGLSVAGVPRIPHVALTVEDAFMLKRMATRHTADPALHPAVRLRLQMQAVNLPDSPSRNTVADLVGWESPEQVVLVSGHIDSWDVGQGAMDDAGPAFVALQALRLIARAGLQPRRTLRWVGWTTEERGSRGGQAYFDAHPELIDNMAAVMELDNGVWDTVGVRFSGSAAATAILKRVGRTLAGIGASAVVSRDANDGSNGLGIDVRMWAKEGVPNFALAQLPRVTYQPPTNVDGYWDWELPPPVQHFQGDYFFFHHTEGDNMVVLDPDQMDKAAATVAVHIYAMANLEEMLPRGSTVQPELPAVDGESGGGQAGGGVGWMVPALVGAVVGAAAGVLGQRRAGGGARRATDVEMSERESLKGVGE